MESNRRVFLAGLGGLAGGSLLLWTVRRELSAPSVLVSADSNSGPVKVVQFDDAGKKLGVVTVPKVVKTDEEWRKLLEPEQYRVTRHAARNALSRMPTSKITRRDSIAASAATMPSSTRTQNLN